MRTVVNKAAFSTACASACKATGECGVKTMLTNDNAENPDDPPENADSTENHDESPAQWLQAHKGLTSADNAERQKQMLAALNLLTSPAQ